MATKSESQGGTTVSTTRILYLNRLEADNPIRASAKNPTVRSSCSTRCKDGPVCGLSHAIDVWGCRPRSVSLHIPDSRFLMPPQLLVINTCDRVQDYLTLGIWYSLSMRRK